MVNDRYDGPGLLASDEKELSSFHKVRLRLIIHIVLNSAG